MGTAASEAPAVASEDSEAKLQPVEGIGRLVGEKHGLGLLPELRELQLGERVVAVLKSVERWTAARGGGRAGGGGGVIAGKVAPDHVKHLLLSHAQ